MAKLLRANFARLWKSMSFWVCFSLSFGCTALNYLLDYFIYIDTIGPSEAAMDSYLFQFSNVIFFGAIFVALFLGTDYSCGTVRNKMIVGCGRMEIYFANLITAACGNLMLVLGVWAAIFMFGLPLGGFIEMSAGQFLLYAAVVFAAVIAMTAIYVLLAMLITSKSMISTLTIVASVVMLLAVAIIMQRLQEPEYTSNWVFSVDGGLQEGESEKNPFYVTGTTRDILTLIVDVLPSGQIIQIEANQPHDPHIMPLYSAGVLTAVTAAGAAAFRKKDIK